MKLIAVALPFEAAPIIKALKLKQIEKRAFTLYENESYKLIVTGVGKMAMAAGVGYLYGSCKNEAIHEFLNVGIAGHPTLALGSFILAHKITDLSALRDFYPHIPAGFKGDTHPVLTIEKPAKEFSQNACYEMEASAFFQTAIRFTSVERIQVVKVVSDNQLSPFTELTKEKVSDLIEKNLHSILSLC